MKFNFHVTLFTLLTGLILSLFRCWGISPSSSGSLSVVFCKVSSLLNYFFVLAFNTLSFDVEIG